MYVVLRVPLHFGWFVIVLICISKDFDLLDLARHM
jgi:hypothetical protein